MIQEDATPSSRDAEAIGHAVMSASLIAASVVIVAVVSLAWIWMRGPWV